MTKRPLCIDSKVVERVDRLSNEGSQTIFRCALNRGVPYSAFFSERSRDLTYRVQQIERVLENIEPFYRKVQVAVLTDRPYLFQVHGHQIYIGEKLLEAPGHLERALIKVWYRERNEALFAQQDLMEDAVTDFLLFLDSGDIDVGDPDTRIKTALHKIKWPYVLKSVPAYCESPWKRSEHYAICRNPQEAEEVLHRDVVEMSLRPLIVTSWISSFKTLNGQDRYSFIQNISKLLRSEHLPALPLTLPVEGPEGSGSSLAIAASAIRNVNAFFSTSSAMRASEIHRVFVAHFTNELRERGFQDAFAEAFFDVLYVSQEPLTTKSPVLKEFLKISNANPRLQIAVHDQNSLWMLPSKHPIPLKSFGQLRAHRTVVEKCGGYSFDYVMNHSSKTEKLLVVDHCDSSKKIHYARFIQEGAEGFAAENKTVTFVQFHLPSLLMKKGELVEVANVLDFIQKRDVENASFKSLGWKEVHWSKQANAYQPKAFVDAIEWFRVTN